MRWSVVCSISRLVALVLFTASAAHAQETPLGEEQTEAKRKAQQLVTDGNKLMSERKFVEALVLYEAAYDAYPSPKITFNLAEVHRELGHLDRAASYYDRFLTSSNVAPSSEAFVEATKQLETLSRFVGKLVLEMNEPGLDVAVDGVIVARTPDESIWLVRGRHEITLSRSGQMVSRDTVDVTPNERTVLRPTPLPDASGQGDLAPGSLALAPQPDTQIASSGPDIVGSHALANEDESKSGLFSKWWFWTVVGAAAAAGAGVVVATQVSGGSFTPNAELGLSSTAEWDPL